VGGLRGLRHGSSVGHNRFLRTQGADGSDFLSGDAIDLLLGVGPPAIRESVKSGSELASGFCQISLPFAVVFFFIELLCSLLNRESLGAYAMNNGEVFWIEISFCFADGLGGEQKRSELVSAQLRMIRALVQSPSLHRQIPRSCHEPFDIGRRPQIGVGLFGVD
jgi:hypothetical protein